MEQASSSLTTEEFMLSTDHTCAECSESLVLTDIVVLLQLAVPQRNEQGQLVASPFLNGAGGLAYEAFFFHDGCWASQQEALMELIEEYDVATLEDAYSIVNCAGCLSGIRAGELSGMAQTGELQRSKREPNGVRSVHFSVYAEMTQFFCLSCIRAINDEQLEMWNHISYAGECAACTHERNWRSNTPCRHNHG